MPMPVRISKTEIDAVLQIETGIFRDARGFLSESYSQPIWAEAGFTETFVQDNLSLSSKGTLRGMHYQLEPHAMGKLVRVMTGSIFDVAVDLRREAPTFGRWVGRTLSAANALSLWVPKGFAHGFLALEDATLVHYKCTAIHMPEAERALSFADPSVAITWPQEPLCVSDKDRTALGLEEIEVNFGVST